MRLLLFSIFLYIVHNQAIAQENCFSNKYVSLYQEIITGQKQFNDLKNQDKICVNVIVKMLSRSSAPKNTDDCEDAWDEANSTADDVVYYSKRLITCVENSDHSDDCYSEARRVRSYHSDYESAVSEVQYECY
jgi:hypothetical protein